MGAVFIKTLIIMIALLAFIVPGFILQRKRMLGEGAPLTLSNLLLYVCQPAMILSSFCVFSDGAWAIICEMSKAKLALDFLIVAALSATVMFAMFGIARLVLIKYPNRKKADVYTYIAVFSNCGFLGVPFIEMFSGGNPVAVLYITVFNIVFIILSWTLGVVLVSGSFQEVSVKKILLNPSIIASALALLLFFVPEINLFMLPAFQDLQILPKYLSAMTSPVSMLIVGIRLADINVKTLFSDKGSYLAGALRLIVAPFATCLIAFLVFLMLRGAYPATGTSDMYIYFAPIIAMVMTPASSVIALSERFDGDKQTATVSFTVNTLISIITIPLVMSAIMAIWPVL